MRVGFSHRLNNKLMSYLSKFFCEDYYSNFETWPFYMFYYGSPYIFIFLRAKNSRVTEPTDAFFERSTATMIMLAPSVECWTCTQEVVGHTTHQAQAYDFSCPYLMVSPVQTLGFPFPIPWDFPCLCLEIITLGICFAYSCRFILQ